MEGKVFEMDPWGIGCDLGLYWGGGRGDVNNQ